MIQRNSLIPTKGGFCAVDPDEDYFMTNYSKASTTISQNTMDGLTNEMEETATISSFGMGMGVGMGMGMGNGYVYGQCYPGAGVQRSH